MTTTAKQLTLRVFQEPTGFFFCDDSLDHLDARGTCYPDAATATTMAVEIGRQKERHEGIEFIGVTGSGVDRETAELLNCDVIA